MGCHGLNAVSGLLIPDLRGSALIHDQAAFDNVVLGGALRDKGMASFASELDAEKSAAIRAYVIQQAIRGQRVQASQ
jgi:mono/diheme cytochrome c family protein